MAIIGGLPPGPGTRPEEALCIDHFRDARLQPTRSSLNTFLNPRHRQNQDLAEPWLAGSSSMVFPGKSIS